VEKCWQLHKKPKVRYAEHGNQHDKNKKSGETKPIKFGRFSSAEMDELVSYMERSENSYKAAFVIDSKCTDQMSDNSKFSFNIKNE
jgi:uncharacterized membrane protein